MQKNSFTALSGIIKIHPVTPQFPIEILVADNGHITVSNHLNKNTDHYKAFTKNNQVPALFNRPHCYASESWYNNPPSASTWNYMAVQAKGTLNFTDEEGTYQAIKPSPINTKLPQLYQLLIKCQKNMYNLYLVQLLDLPLQYTV